MEPPARPIALLPPLRRTDRAEGPRAARRRQERYRYDYDEAFDIPAGGGGGYADYEPFNPYHEPGMGHKAGGRLLFAAQRLSQEGFTGGLAFDPWDMATSAYAQAAALGRWY